MAFTTCTEYSICISKYRYSVVTASAVVQYELITWTKQKAQQVW